MEYRRINGIVVYEGLKASKNPVGRTQARGNAHVFMGTAPKFALTRAHAPTRTRSAPAPALGPEDNTQKWEHDRPRASLHASASADTASASADATPALAAAVLDAVASTASAAAAVACAVAFPACGVAIFACDAL